MPPSDPGVTGSTRNEFAGLYRSYGQARSREKTNRQKADTASDAITKRNFLIMADRGRRDAQAFKRALEQSGDLENLRARPLETLTAFQVELVRGPAQRRPSHTHGGSPAHGHRPVNRPADQAPRPPRDASPRPAPEAEPFLGETPAHERQRDRSPSHTDHSTERPPSQAPWPPPNELPRPPTEPERFLQDAHARGRQQEDRAAQGFRAWREQEQTHVAYAQWQHGSPWPQSRRYFEWPVRRNAAGDEAWLRSPQQGRLLLQAERVRQEPGGPYEQDKRRRQIE